MGYRDPMPFRFADRVFDLIQGLILLEPVEDLLRAGLDTVRQEAAVRLAHDGQMIDHNRINPTFASPAELELPFYDTPADFVDALVLQQEVVIRKIDRAVSHIVELLHFTQDVLR